MSVNGHRNKIREKTKPIEEEITSGGVDSILAALYRKILFGLGIRGHRFSYLLEKYLSDQRNKAPQNVKERSSARGNLRKELMRPVMTWKVFCKGLRFINIKRFDIIIHLHHANKEISEHKWPVILGDEVDDG